MKPFKSRKTLAQELKIHPRTLSRYMRTHGIEWGKKPMPSQIWEKVMRELCCEDAPALSGAKNLEV